MMTDTTSAENADTSSTKKPPELALPCIYCDKIVALEDTWGVCADKACQDKLAAVLSMIDGD